MREMKRTSPWLVRQIGTEAIRARLICLPYAGGNARVFHGWADSLKGVEVLAVEAPGKGGRILEPPCTDLEQLCRELVKELEPILQDTIPYNFFGHSNGALVAYELCCRLQALGVNMPRRLFLSASGAPWESITSNYSSLDDKAFKSLLHGLRATPPEILANDALFELLLPGLRADFSLGENYKRVWPALRGIITHVLHGADDLISEAELSAWQQRIELPIDFESLPGGHFFIHDERKALLAAVSRQLSGELRRAHLDYYRP